MVNDIVHNWEPAMPGL